MFKQRLISGIILVIIAFVTLYFGGMLTLLVTAGISLIGMYELLHVIKIEKSALAVIAYSGAVLYYVLVLLNLNQYDIPLMLLILVMLFVVYVFTFPKYEISGVAIAFFQFFMLQSCCPAYTRCVFWRTAPIWWFSYS